MQAIEIPETLRQKVDSLRTVADKIRLLDENGIARAEIARILGKRYQHIRNVLERDAGKAAQEELEALSSTTSLHSGFKMKVSADGKLDLPKVVLEALNLDVGGGVLAQVTDGELRIISSAAALKKAQALVQGLVPSDVSMAQELITERRNEALRDGGT